MQQKLIGGRALPGPAGEIIALLDPSGSERDKNRNGRNDRDKGG